MSDARPPGTVAKILFCLFCATDCPVLKVKGKLKGLLSSDLSDARPPGMRTVAGSIFMLVRLHSFVKIGHAIISTAILSLPLIQEGQLSVTATECALSTGKLPRRNILDRLTDCARNDLQSVEGP